MSQEQEEGERVRGELGPSDDELGPSGELRLRLALEAIKSLRNKAAAMSPAMRAGLFGDELGVLATWLDRGAQMQADAPAEQAAADRGKPMGVA